MDSSFGENGFVVTDLGEMERVVDLVLSEDQSSIFVGGDMNHLGYHEMKVACYHTGFSVGLSDNSKESGKLIVFPNPAGDHINIVYELSDCYTAQIFDLSGRLIIQETMKGNEALLQIGTLESGTYILKLAIDNIPSVSSIFIKQ
jgi:hypothetical protein